MARTAGDIRARIALGEWIIRSIADDPDPRREAAIAHLREQIAVLKAELDTAEEAPVVATGLSRPNDVVIGMKTVSMRGIIGGRDG
jgi:hypothetical protein